MRFRGVIPVSVAFFALPLASQAFETTSSFSLFRLDINSPFSSYANAGLISSSFQDMFSRVDISSSRTEFRFLEAEKPVDEEKIRKHVDQEYPGAPEKVKKEIADTLVLAKKTDEILKGKTASPSVPDDLKIQYGQERVRLLEETYRYEGRMRAEYMNEVKPQASALYRENLRQLDYSVQMALDCDTASDSSEVSRDCPFGMEHGKALSSVTDKMLMEAHSLAAAPVEKTLDGNSFTFMKGKAHDLTLDFSSYLHSLYGRTD